jgi:predicted secreted hydrolase
MSASPTTPPVRSVKRRQRHKRSFKRIGGPFLAGLLVLLAIAAWLFVLMDGPDSHQRQMAALPAPTAPISISADTLVHLPRDDAPHHNTTEWWYYNGHLHTEAGQRYAYHVAVFLRRALADHTMFHVSLVDLQTGKHYTGQARTEGIPAVPRRDGFDFNYAGWQVAGSGPQHRLNIVMEDFSFALDLADVHPPTLHQAPGVGGPGLLDFKTAGKSFYYSRMRIPTHGTLTVGGVSRQVTGQSWFDHQWGDFLGTDVGWNWFAIQLDDGADIMLYQVFDPQGKPLLQAGTYKRDGQTIALGKDDYALKSIGSWTSPDSQVTYPVAWALSIPSQKLELTAKPFVNACEFNGLASILTIYWEGPILIGGSSQGVGYLELSGYNKTSKK